MKKVFMMSIILVFGILLTGCDLLSQDVQDDITELVCADDPDNPICYAETLQDLEEDTVIDLVEEVMLKAKEKANKTKCSSLIAPGSVDLIETCSTDDFFFLPEDVETFTPLSVMRDGLYYVVTGVTDDENDELIFKLKVVLIDGTYYVEDWQMTFNRLGGNELSYELVKEFVFNFVSDFDDATIPTEDFCLTYYGTPPIDEDCDGMRESFLSTAQSLELNYLDDDDDDDGIYRGVVIITSGDGTTEEVEVDFEVFRQEFGPVQMRKVTSYDDIDNDCDGVCTNEDLSVEEVQTLFEMFVADYLNPDKTDAELNEMYFRGMNSEFYSNRADDLANGLTVVVLKVEYHVDSFFDIFIEVHIGDEMDTQTIPLYIYQDDMGYYFEFVEMNNYIDDTQVIMNSVQQYLMYYMDTSISDDELLSMYPDIYLPSSFPERAVLFNGHVNVMRATAMPDSFFDVEVEIISSGVSRHFTLEVRVNRIDMALTVYDGVDDDCDGIDDDCNFYLDPVEVREIIIKAVVDYSDSSISDEDINYMYGEGTFPNTFPARSSILDGHVTVLKVTAMPDSFFDIHVEIETVNGITEWHLEVRVNRIEMAIIINDTADDGCGITCDYILNPDEVLTHVNTFLTSYMDPTVTDDQLLADFNMDGAPDLVVLRSSVLDGHVTVLKAAYSHDSFFDIHVEFTTPNGETIQEIIVVKVNRIDMAMTIDDDCDGYCGYVEDTEELLMIAEDFFNMWVDETISDDEINDMYFLGMGNEFFEFRPLSTNQGYVVTVMNPVPLFDGYFQVDVTFTNSVGEATYQYVIRIQRYMNDYVFGFTLSMDHDVPLTTEQVNMVLDNYMYRHNGMSIISTEMCPMMVVESQVETCAYNRDSMISNGYQLVSHSHEDQGGGLYLVTLSYSNGLVTYDEAYEVMFRISDYGYVLEMYRVMTYEELVYQELYGYMEFMNSSLYTVDETCQLVTLESYDECSELKTFLLANFGFTEIVGLNFDTGIITFRIVYGDMDPVDVSYDFGLEDTATGTVMLYIDRGDRGVNPLFESNN